MVKDKTLLSFIMEAGDLARLKIIAVQERSSQVALVRDLIDRFFKRFLCSSVTYMSRPKDPRDVSYRVPHKDVIKIYKIKDKYGLSLSGLMRIIIKEGLYLPLTSTNPGGRKNGHGKDKI